jgi:hypothetical protein
MSVDDLDLPVEPELDARLRETLSRVAMTIGDTTPGLGTSPARTPGSLHRPRRRRWRTKLVIVGVALAALSLAGFAYVQFWPEHVTEQTLAQLRKDALVEGGVEPNRYWLVPAFHTDGCGRPMPGVELIAEAANRAGAEWNTGAVAYGEPSSPTTDRNRGLGVPSAGCLRYEERAWLDDPSRVALTITRLGQYASPEEGDWALLAAVHPSVQALRVTTPKSPAHRISTVPRVERPNGPRYAAIVLPAMATTVQVTLLDQHGAPVPGGTRSLNIGR